MARGVNQWRIADLPSKTADETPETPAMNNEQSQPPAPEIQSAPAEYVTLNHDVGAGHGATKVVISAGTQLPVVSLGSHIVVVRFCERTANHS